MSTGKVIYLSLHGMGEKPSDKIDEQFELFRRLHVPNAIAFLDPGLFNQEKFLSIIARQQFGLIFDLRIRPIFRKPAYDHRLLMHYFYNRRIPYYDLARIHQCIKSEFLAMVTDMETSLFEKGKEARHTLCLTDKDSNDSGVVQSFRRSLVDGGGKIVELNPRSFIS